MSAIGMESQVQIAESKLARIHIVARTRRAKASGSIGLRSSAAWRSPCAPGRTTSRRRCLHVSMRRTRCICSQSTLRAFPAAYTEDFSGDAAALDVAFLEAAEKEPEGLHLDIYRPEPRRQRQILSEDIPQSTGRDPDLGSLAHARETWALKVMAERPYGLEFPGGRRLGSRISRCSSRAPRSPKFSELSGEIKSTFTGRVDRAAWIAIRSTN